MRRRPAPCVRTHTVYPEVAQRDRAPPPPMMPVKEREQRCSQRDIQLWESRNGEPLTRRALATHLECPLGPGTELPAPDASIPPEMRTSVGNVNQRQKCLITPGHQRICHGSELCGGGWRRNGERYRASLSLPNRSRQQLNSGAPGGVRG